MLGMKPISYRVMAFDVTEEELIADELREVIPGCEVRSVRQVGRDRWLADVRKLGKRETVTETIKTRVIAMTPISASTCSAMRPSGILQGEDPRA